MDKVIKLLEKSVFAPLLLREDVTDISYNGETIFYFSTKEGRKKYKRAESFEMMTLVRNIANLTNKRFSYTDVFLDASFAKYRFSAMHHAIGRHNFQEVVTFALRINNEYLQKNNDYVSEQEKAILEQILLARKSIVICGATGVGKTTMQKYLLTLLAKQSRVIVIDNVLELDEVKVLNKNIDLTLWQLGEQSEKEINDFIKRALRFHPDYLIVAESRGSEMKEIYQGAITGHPNIFTIHAENTNLAYQRMKYLCQEEQIETMYEAFPYIIFLEKTNTMDGVVRAIETIGAYDYKKGKITPLYTRGKNDE